MWLRGIYLLIPALSGAVWAAGLYGKFRWHRASEHLIRSLRAAQLPIRPLEYTCAELAGLPPPVQRYFRTTLGEHQPMVAAARIAHEGEFNMAESSERWVRFESYQLTTTQRPGFIWDARIHVAPALRIFVHDALVGGAAVLRGKLLGLLTVTEQETSPELALGELMRYLAEAAWYPTALLPSQGVRWEPIDESAARATLKDGLTSVTLEFHFRPDGLISTVRSEDRYRSVDGEQVATPWEGLFWNYQKRNGMLIPIEGEVAWLLPERRLPYWRGRLTAIDHEFAG